MNIIVTGGAGFIGSHVADAFIKEGHRVIIIDNLSTGREENINPKAEFHKLNINDPEVEDIFKNNKIDILDHHAAQIDVRKSVADPVFDADTNIIGAIKLMEYGRKYGVKKVIFSSTGGAIYGEPDYIPVDEKHPTRPMAPYGTSKLCFEQYLLYYNRLYNTDFTILRYANIYGPRQDPHGEAGVVAIFSNIMLEGKQPKIFGDGESTRDYLCVFDVVKANLMALEKGSGEIYNLGTGKETSVNELFENMRAVMKIDLEPIYAPARLGEVERIALDNTKAREKFGWKPDYNLDKGLAMTIDFFASRNVRGNVGK